MKAELTAVLFLFFLFAVMGTILWALKMRFNGQELRHRERLAALEKGVAVPPEPAGKPWSHRVYLLRGLIWLFSGIALFAFLAAVATERPSSVSDKIREELFLKNMGASEEQLKQFERDYRPRQTGPSPGLALIALIPAGVGLAYILFYWSEQKAQSGSEAR